MNHVIKRLNRLMAERQMTVLQLHEKCGINRAYIYKILAGKVDPEVITLGTFEKLARGVEVSLTYLLHDPGAREIENLKNQLTDEEKAIIDSFDLLDLDDKKRKAILEILKIVLRKDSTSDNPDESCDSQL